MPFDTQPWHLARQVLTPLGDAVIATDVAGRVVLINPAAQALLGLAEADALGQQPDHLFRLETPEEQTWITGLHHRLVRNDGSSLVVELTQQPLLDANNQAQGLLWVLRDQSGQLVFAETLVHMAGRDGLTGLVNASIFQDRLDQAMAIARRNERCLGLIIFSLEEWPSIVATWGLDVADQLLQQLAQRLLTVLRRSDTACRLDTHRFGLLLTEVSDVRDIDFVAQKALALCLQPIDIHGQSLKLPLVVGCSSFPDDGSNASVLMHTALERARVE